MAIKYGKKSREELLEIIEAFHLDAVTPLYLSLNKQLLDISKLIKGIKYSKNGVLTDDDKDNMMFIKDWVRDSAHMAKGMAMLREGANKDDIEKEFNFENFMESDD